ncbi:MAG: DegT/DnrJ/EryC1/StrS family aminotransferase [Patescibacteria group bacterium]|jgi:dTDP-4-amino-4,6-dideoxygalactose transaminase
MLTSFNIQAEKIEKLKSCRLSVFGRLEKDIVCTFSGKTALSLVLKYFRQNGTLSDKTGEVMVPSWLGGPVYMIMHKFCFPTVFYNKKVKVLMAYHQWGFPQDIDYLKDFCEDKKLVMIEDCAHAFRSYYKGKRLGTFGQAAIFSFAKFFSSIAGGAIYSEDKKLKKFAERELSQGEDKLSRKAFYHNFKVGRKPDKNNLIELERYYAVYDRLGRCPAYSLNKVKSELAGENNALARRKKNFFLLREAFKNCRRAELFSADDILPWALPLFTRKGAEEKVVHSLKKINIISGVYHFDVNKNMLKPKFERCVGLPCHQGLGERELEDIIKAVKANI